MQKTYEMWISLANEEENLLKNKENNYKKLCSFYSDFLLSVIEYHYLNRNKKQEKDDKDEWTNSKSGSLLLHHLSIIGEISIVEYVFNFYNKYFLNEDVFIKDSVIMAFGSIQKSIHSNKIKELIINIFPNLMNIFFEKSILVKCTAAWTISKICKYHIDCLIYMSNTYNDFANNFNSIMLKNIYSLKRVSYYSLDSIIQIPKKTKIFYENNNQGDNLYKTCVLSSSYETYLISLLNLSTQNQVLEEFNFSKNAFYAISDMIDNCPLDSIDIVKGFFGEIINTFNYVDEKISDSETRSFYMDFIFFLINSYIQKENNYSEEQYLFLYKICHRILYEKEIPFISGILMLGNLIKISNENSFKELMTFNNDIIKWIYLGISTWQDIELSENSIRIISDLVDNIPDVIYPHLKNILNKVIEIGRVRKILFIKIFSFLISIKISNWLVLIYTLISFFLNMKFQMNFMYI